MNSSYEISDILQGIATYLFRHVPSATGLHQLYRSQPDITEEGPLTADAQEVYDSLLEAAKGSVYSKTVPLHMIKLIHRQIAPHLKERKGFSS